jgi:[ribosomal protein S18]-alanine N-acetyltransferase
VTTADLARLHAACFTVPRPWTEAEILSLSAPPYGVLLQDGAGFLIGRIVAAEAEVLTLAVDPATRRQGIGARLVADFLEQARSRGAIDVFLEVAADNLPAQALYHAAGFAESGRRRGYYRQADGTPLDAIVMARRS